MTDPLDITLDQLVKMNKKVRSRRERRRNLTWAPRESFRSSGPTSRIPVNRAIARPSPYPVAKASKNSSPPDLYLEGHGTGTKLFISNLHYGVLAEDLKALFSEFGDIKRYSIHHDKNGRPKGTGEIVFAKESDAIAALLQYNSVLLDGRPLLIELVGTDLPVAPALSAQGVASGEGSSKSSKRGRGKFTYHRRSGSGERGQYTNEIVEEVQAVQETNDSDQDMTCS
ncbi:hypothetical protein O6H91_02G137300 [Diphasiastrum complanatum]|uniref:Uncharacterized protein n=1 Tax=Diphasiastrum complanatum TaxID=34168 RepID=A0ACC2ELG5_DIPCM|nr:hypothetical protein O6H91_02G137300 [Diphasiastrum complanatum]